MVWFHLALFFVGFALFWWRLRPLERLNQEMAPKEKRQQGRWPLREHSQVSPQQSYPLVSVVVPARDEEHNIDRLLNSLKQLDYPEYEVIVVDDESTDATAERALQHGVKVISSKPRPRGWMGKSWACYQGAAQAQGELFLFTDADTCHRPQSLRLAVGKLLEQGGGLLSAPPYHLSEQWWERIMGPFHLLVLAASGAYVEPKPGQTYAIGQYLLFTKQCYRWIGTHQAIRSEVAEDIALAERVLAVNEPYSVYQRNDLYAVRMYGSLIEHCKGWRRILQAGLSKSSWQSAVLMVFVINSLFLGGLWKEPVAAIALYGLVVAFFVGRQRREGDLSALGPVLYPLPLLLFCLLSVVAFIDGLRKRPARWKGRSIEVIKGSS